MRINFFSDKITDARESLRWQSLETKKRFAEARLILGSFIVVITWQVKNQLQLSRLSKNQ